MVDAGAQSSDAAGSDVYAKPEPKHLPDAMPHICNVATCYSLKSGHDLGHCDPCQDAGTLCWLFGENGVCEFR